MQKIVVHTAKTTGDDLRSLIGLCNSRLRTLEGIAASLRIIEALWYSADVETRQHAQRWTGWKQWVESVRRAIEWA